MARSSRARPLLARMASISLILCLGALCVGASVHAAPPPDANGQFRDWFKSLLVPDYPGVPCCTVADCRMVEARWNAETRHQEAKLTRDAFGAMPPRRAPALEDNSTDQEAKEAWLMLWKARFGESSELWLEVPDSKVNPVPNPTGHAVLCWSIFNTKNNGVYCFMPFQAAFNDRRHRTRTYG